MPTEFRLNRSGDVPLVFAGERIANASSWRKDGPGEARWHEIDLYRTAAGAYVLAVVFRSLYAGEDDVFSATVAPTVEGLRQLISTFPTTPAGIGYPTGAAYEERQKRLNADLARRFGSAVTELFGSVPDAVERID